MIEPESEAESRDRVRARVRVRERVATATGSDASPKPQTESGAQRQPEPVGVRPGPVPAPDRCRCWPIRSTRAAERVLAAFGLIAVRAAGVHRVCARAPLAGLLLALPALAATGLLECRAHRLR